MQHVTDFPRRIVEIADMGIPMPDGVRLSARVWMPEDAGAAPVPVVLEYIPYRKRDGTLDRDELMHPYVAGQGYACVRVDIRGNGDSQGLMTDEYTEQELSDACEVIAWLAAQPWCTGAVGMMGKSWGVFNCLQTAFLRPPALKAVVSVCSTTDRFADDIHFKGGCLLGENFGWASVMLSYSGRPADPVLRPDWRADWLNRLDNEPFLGPRWAGHQARDAYWKHGSVCEDWDAIQAAVLTVGGWADNYMNTCGHLARNLSAPVKGIVGPWVHQYPHTAVPGPAIGFLHVMTRWWDHWLKGIDNGVDKDPNWTAWMLDSAPPDASAAYRPGRWITTAGPDGNAVVEYGLGEGRLGEAAPFSATIATPQDLGLLTGKYFPMGLNAEMPGNQAADDARSLCFDSAALAEPMQVLGQAMLRLRLSSDKPLGFIAVRMNDVAPDGSSVRIAHGMLNLCHRDSMEDPVPMVPGEEIGVSISLDLSAYRLAVGHRLRIALSNSYWPFLWPSPEAGRLTVTGGGLSVPVLTGEAGIWTPPAPQTARPANRRREGDASIRRIERDLIAGTVALLVEDDLGRVENLDTGLVNIEKMTERWEIRPEDPLSARHHTIWHQGLSRGDWQVSTRAETLMTATATHLVMHARLTAWEGEVQVFDREWNEEVPRRFV